MDPTTLYILSALGGFLISHFNLIPFLPKPTPTPPALPTSVGHGEIIKYLEQLLANVLAKTQQPTPPPTPTPDLATLLAQILALLEKQLQPQPK